MDVVMFHSGREGLPEYLEDTFRQFRIFNPTDYVYFLTDKQHVHNSLFEKYHIMSLDKDDFYSEKISKFTLYFKYYDCPKNDQFWVITAIRLIYIENFMKKIGLKDIIHFENDILLYSTLNTFYSKFLKLYSSMAITVGGPDKCMTGLMFISGYKALEQMTNFWINKLKIEGRSGLKRTYHMDMVNEMTLMRAYSKDYTERLSFLPILPFGDFSSNYAEFNSIFDPASWGQFIGGNAQERIPELKPQDHYIGVLLREHPDYSVVWKVDEIGRKIPYFKFDGQEVKINNLHIHSKELSKYMSL